MNDKKLGHHQWVEALLSANPVDLADDGFSKRVRANIRRHERQRLLILAPFFVGAFALFLGFFPYELFEGMLGVFSADYYSQLPFLAPLGAIVGMFLYALATEEVA